MDHRVLKNGLTLLQTLFSSFKDKSRIIHLLADMMEKDAFDAKGISLLLETFDVFLNDLDMETVWGCEMIGIGLLIDCVIVWVEYVDRDIKSQVF